MTDKNRFRRWAKNTLYHHKRKGFDVRISVEDLEAAGKQAKRCAYCGCELDWSFRVKHICPNSPTLDRINNESFLTLDNCAIVCHRCNEAKGHLSLCDFYRLCQAVVSELGLYT